MKKLLLFAFASGIIAGAECATATIDGVTWTYTIEDGSARIGGESSSDRAVSVSMRGELTIPSSFEGHSLTCIGGYAFWDCSGLTSVSIPSSVTSIGSVAFEGCSGLQSVTIPSSVTSIGSAAFQGCSGIQSVTIPSSVANIGMYAFRDCSGLTSVTISDGVTSIGQGVFSGCSGLTSVTIPSSVTSIGEGAFSCGNLCDIVVVADNPNYKSVNDFLLSKDGATLVRGPSKDSVIIPSSVRRIGGDAFEYCRRITSVMIPSSVSDIGYGAFSYCSGLTSVTIPSSVSSVYKHAFYHCSGLTSVMIQDGVTSIEEEAFYGCSSLASVTIPLSVTHIGERAFRGCSGLTSMTIPNSVTSIGLSAFYDCKSLKTIYVDVGGGNRVKALLEGSGFDVSVLSFVETDSNGGPYTTVVNGIKWTYLVNNGEAQVGTGSSSGRAISTSTKGEITIPSVLGGYPVTSIGDYAFYECNSLTSVTIPSRVMRIGNDAFSHCVGIVSVMIPSSVASIGRGAFSSCSGLTSVTIPPSVTSIGKYAFYRCTGLRAVTIPSSVTSIGESAFCYCSALMSFVVDSENPEFCAIDALLCSKDGKTLIAGVNGDVSIPLTVISIVSSAFEGCSGLKSVTIPQSVTCIGSSAFSGCSGLTAVLIPDGVMSIGESAFHSCSGLISVTIPSSVRDIGHRAFEYCSALKSFSVAADNLFYKSQDGLLCSKDGSTVVAGVNGVVDLPDGVTSIGYAAFSGCSGLASVTIPSSVTSIGFTAFNACSGLTSVTIPEGVTSIGDAAFSGCSGLASVTIPKSATSIGMCAFYGCSGLKSVTIPSSATSIGYDAFRGCSGLTTVTIPWCDKLSTIFPDAYTKIKDVVIQEGVQTIWGRSFENCSGLTSVTIPSSVTRIVKNAFYGCSDLKTVYVSGEGDIDAIKRLLSQSGFDVSSVTFSHVKMPVASCTVTFNANGGATSVASREIEEGSAIGELPTAAREGYKFLGWFTAASEGMQVTADTIVTADVTWFAVWERDPQGDWTVEEYLNCTNLTFTLGGDTPLWYGEKVTRADKVGMMRSGAIADSQTNWIETVVSGAGQIGFWWKASGEYEVTKKGVVLRYDYAEFTIDGVFVGEIGDESDWTYVTIPVEGEGPHVLRWMYHKDESGSDGDDCAWLSEVSWEPTQVAEPIPELPENSTAEHVQSALAGSADSTLLANVTDAATYNAYREWALKIGAAEVKASSFAWVSFATDSEVLLAKMPTDDDLKVEEFKPSATAGSFDFTVSVEGVTIGDKASEDNLKKLFGLEGTESLDPAAFSSAKVALEFKEPQGGKLKFTATSAVDNAKSFFMKAKVK